MPTSVSAFLIVGPLVDTLNTVPVEWTFPFRSLLDRLSQFGVIQFTRDCLQPIKLASIFTDINPSDSRQHLLGDLVAEGMFHPAVSPVGILANIGHDRLRHPVGKSFSDRLQNFLVQLFDRLGDFFFFG